MEAKDRSPGVDKYGNPNQGYGNSVAIRHRDEYGREFYAMYSHLSSISVPVGGTVTAETKIGVSGSSGTKDPHLHLQIATQLNGKECP